MSRNYLFKASRQIHVKNWYDIWSKHAINEMFQIKDELGCIIWCMFNFSFQLVYQIPFKFVGGNVYKNFNNEQWNVKKASTQILFYYVKLVASLNKQFFKRTLFGYDINEISPLRYLLKFNRIHSCKKKLDTAGNESLVQIFSIKYFYKTTNACC